MYGEVGRYMQSSIESVPWFLTRAEKMAAKNPKKWDAGMSSTSVQKQTTKRPAEMDVVPQGVKVTTGAKPEKMTMADHDHGIVWPPPKGQESSLPFMAMVNKERDGLPVATKDFRGEVNGIMIGYQGHVPRARDKIGSCPLGQVPGRPGAPSLSNDPGYVQSSKAVKGGAVPAPPNSSSKPTAVLTLAPTRVSARSLAMRANRVVACARWPLAIFNLPDALWRCFSPACTASEPSLYISEAHDPQLKSTFKPGQRIHASMDRNDDYKGGVPPGYAGHVHGSRYMVGQSVYSTADTYGHPDSQGATAKQFSSQVDARGASYDELSSIYGNDFVAE
jgi:hypothetical protein